MGNFFDYITKNKKVIFFAFLFFIVVGIITPQPAFASLFSSAGWLTGVVFGGTAQEAIARQTNYIIEAVMGIPLLISGIFSFLAGSLLRLVLNLTTSGVSYTSTNPALNPVIAAGWPIIRDFANIFVVLGFIGIALATILRFKEYEAKSLLAKLIIAALLINFSLVICGIVIDISNITVKYLFTGGTTTIIRTNEISSTIRLAMDGIDRNTSPYVFIVAVLGNIFYNVTQGLVAFLYVFLFLFRIMALWILVLLSPLAFVFSVFPRTRSFFEMWFSNFTQWCIIGIPGALFLYLGDKIMAALSAPSPFIVLNTPDAGASTIAVAITQGLIGLFTFFIPGAFLILGFLFSVQTSAIGSDLAIKWGRKVVDAGYSVGKWTGKLAVAGGAYGAKGAAGGVGGTIGWAMGVVRGLKRDGWQNPRKVLTEAGKGTVAGAEAGVGAVQGAVDIFREGKTIKQITGFGDHAMEAAGLFGIGASDATKKNEQDEALKDPRERMAAIDDVEKLVKILEESVSATEKAAAVERLLQLKALDAIPEAIRDIELQGAIKEGISAKDIAKQSPEHSELDQAAVKEAKRRQNLTVKLAGTINPATKEVWTEQELEEHAQESAVGAVRRENYALADDKDTAKLSDKDKMRIVQEEIDATGNVGVKGAQIIDQMAEKGTIGKLAKVLGTDKLGDQVDYITERYGSNARKGLTKVDPRMATRDIEAVHEERDKVLDNKELTFDTANKEQQDRAMRIAERRVIRKANTKINARDINDMDDKAIDMNFIEDTTHKKIQKADNLSNEKMAIFETLLPKVGKRISEIKDRIKDTKDPVKLLRLRRKQRDFERKHRAIRAMLGLKTEK